MVAQVRTVDQQRGPQPDIPVGSTPVHAAAFRGDLAIVQAMLQVPQRNCIAKSAVHLLVADLQRIGALVGAQTSHCAADCGRRLHRPAARAQSLLG